MDDLIMALCIIGILVLIPLRYKAKKDRDNIINGRK